MSKPSCFDLTKVTEVNNLLLSDSRVQTFGGLDFILDIISLEFMYRKFYSRVLLFKVKTLLRTYFTVGPNVSRYARWDRFGLAEVGRHKPGATTLSL